MGRLCSYYKCMNISHKHKSVRMFKFPKNYLLCETWVLNTGNPELLGLSPVVLNKTRRVCQAHFDEKQILASGRLKANSVPVKYTEDHQFDTTSTVQGSQHPPAGERVTPLTCSASSSGQPNSSVECSGQNNLDLSSVKTEPDDDPGASVEQTSYFTVKQEHDIEIIDENGDEKNLNVSDKTNDEEQNSSQELYVYNIHEDIEFVCVDAVKVEADHSLEDCENRIGASSFNQENPLKVEEDKLRIESVGQVQDCENRIGASSFNQENPLKVEEDKLRIESVGQVQDCENRIGASSFNQENPLKVEEDKLRIESVGQVQECGNWADSSSCDQRNVVKEYEVIKLGAEKVFQVQAPLKTYQRKTPARKRPPSWDADIVQKIKKINNTLEQCSSGQGKIDYVDKASENLQVDLNVNLTLEKHSIDNVQKSSKNSHVELNVNYPMNNKLVTLEKHSIDNVEISSKNSQVKLNVNYPMNNKLVTLEKHSIDNVEISSKNSQVELNLNYPMSNKLVTLEKGSIDNVEKSSQHSEVELDVHAKKNNGLVVVSTDEEKQSHVCLFCKQMYNNLFKHFVEKHSEEIEVSFFKSLPKESSVRLWQFVRLKRLGDFQHNITVLESKLGSLIVLQSSVRFLGHCGSDQFLPCPDCTGFVHQSQLYSHYSKCVSKLSRHIPATREIIVEESFKLLRHTSLTYACKRFKWHFQYNSSEYYAFFKQDPCLLLLGLHMKRNCEFLKVENRTNKIIKELIERMARLLLCCRHLSNNFKLVMSDILIPNQVKLLILSVKCILSSTSTYEDKLELHDYFFSKITNCVFIQRAQCLLDGALRKAEEHLKFYYKFLKTWPEEVNRPKPFLKGIRNSQLISSVTILKESLRLRIINLTNVIKSVKKPQQMSTYVNLEESIFCMLCLFNPVMFKVVQNLKVSEYAIRPDWRADNLTDYAQKMSGIAYFLAEDRFVVSTNYKGKEYVLLFTKEIKKAIDLLISKQVSNFVFANLNDPLKCGQNVNMFVNICIRPGFLNSDVIINMKKRQYISFISQISDMSQEEELWINKCYQSIENILGQISLQSPYLQVNELSEVFDECKKACNHMKQAIEDNNAPHR